MRRVYFFLVEHLLVLIPGRSEVVVAVAMEVMVISGVMLVGSNCAILRVLI